MSPGRFMAITISLVCVLSVQITVDPDEVVRYGLTAIVFAILASIERRANR
jgi:hypothetical protein